ncbi:MAG: hypothetical protein ACF8R7_03235 [Phycisphaerales bacterium JB039]
MKRTFLVILAAGLLNAPLSATALQAPLATGAVEAAPVPPAEFAGPSNAALAYYRAWMVAPRDAWQAFKDGDNTALDDLQGTIGALIDSAAIRQCDWGVQYDQGPWALLPHLPELRASARLLQADADRLISAGQIAQAADRVEAMFRMSRHPLRDRMIISSLVSAAISSVACETAGALLDAGALAPADAQRLAEAARLTADPFGAREAIRAEGVVFIGWAQETLTGPDAGQIMAEIAALTGDGAESPLARLNGEQLARALDQLTPYYEQAVAVFADPAAADRLNALERRIQAGEFGPAAKVLAPAMSKVHEQVTRQIDKRNAIIERLRQAANP